MLPAFLAFHGQNGWPTQPPLQALPCSKWANLWDWGVFVAFVEKRTSKKHTKSKALFLTPQFFSDVQASGLANNAGKCSGSERGTGRDWSILQVEIGNVSIMHSVLPLIKKQLNISISCQRTKQVSSCGVESYKAKRSQTSTILHYGLAILTALLALLPFLWDISAFCTTESAHIYLCASSASNLSSVACKKQTYQQSF